jgi:transcriptional regulator with XRE-family HTH domain
LTGLYPPCKLRDMVKTQGQRIRELREEADLSLREFSKKVGGLSAAFLSDVELGRRYASDKILTQMADALGTTLEDLKSYDTRPPVQEMKRLSAEDPAFGLAFRRLIDNKISAEDLLKLANQKSKPGKSKK